MDAPKKQERRTASKGPMPQIIARIPVRSGMTREQWGAEVDRELIKVWTEVSSIKPTRALAALRILSGKRIRKSDLPTEDEFAQLDEIIIAQVATLGWRLMTSGVALYRFCRWSEEPFRPEMFVRLGQELARSVRILARKELPPINDPGLREHKERTVPELGLLLREMRTTFSKRTPAPADEELNRWFLIAIRDSDRFPMLASNPLHWAAFLQSSENQNALKVQLVGRLEPAALFYSWLSWLKGHGPEYLRKQISRLSSLK
jgi:hypothetical protein